MLLSGSRSLPLASNSELSERSELSYHATKSSSIRAASLVHLNSSINWRQLKLLVSSGSTGTRSFEESSDEANSSSDRCSESARSFRA